MASPEQGGRWGILGGTFDPIHNGHLSLARQLSEKSELNGVLFVLAAAHPFKGQNLHAPYEFRRDMLELGLAGHPDFNKSEIEKELELSGYSVDTVRALKRRYPNATFFFLIGSDNLTTLSQWNRIDELTQELEFLVGTRPPADSLVVPDNLKECVTALDIEPVEVSSTSIRERISGGIDKEDLTGLVPERVAEYILRNGLYQ